MFNKSKKFLLVLPLTLALAMAPLAISLAGGPLDLLEKDVLVDIEDQSDRTADAFGRDTNETTMIKIISNVLAAFFGLLATIFIVLMVVAGYNWLTAAGRAEKIEKAQHTIRTAIIGLIIISAAYAITYWVFSRLPD